MNNSFGNNLNTASIGFCISKKTGTYVAKNFITSFKYHWVRGANVITLYTINQSFNIYEHTNEYLDFNSISEKIITRLMDSIRYDIATNTDVDKIIDEVINDV